MDCGWYSDGHWWDGVGEWLPSDRRFPGGIEEVIRYIRDKGMVPGLWLELEVMGINCPMASRVSKDWFFQRNGRPIIDHCRYQLDFRNKEVRDYATGVIKRLVEEYGVGYIKMDYNIDTGVGTECAMSVSGQLISVYPEESAVRLFVSSALPCPTANPPSTKTTANVTNNFFFIFPFLH